jgi:ATP-dependent Zn protease
LGYLRDGSAKGHTPANGNGAVAGVLTAGGSVIGVSHAPERHLPRDLLRVADVRITLPQLDAGLLADVIIGVTGSAPISEVTEDLARRCDLNDFCLARRPGETGEQLLRRLQRLLTRNSGKDDITLEDLAGMDEATGWGKSLAADLQAYRAGRLPWSAVDCGVLVYGPPGTGKTTFARALAASCGAPLITGSLAEWQAAGHLGDLLGAMRAAFDRARASAPAILFIDEIDAFGDRNSFSHENRNYSTQVVNGFLEMLDGIGGREGVVVVGACNHPDSLDPAIVRSGRLDRRIHIPLPDQAALRQIIRHHLGIDLADADLADAAKAAVGASGADVERWVRGARRRARTGNRPMVIEDLLAEIRGSYAPLPDEQRRRTALHEAGHAVAIAQLRPQALVRATIRQTETTSGGVEIAIARGAISTRADFNGLLIHLLAGRAAEEVLLGSVSAGSGGGETSDLARATALATASITDLGLGEDAPLLWLGSVDVETVGALLRVRPDLARAVAVQLERAYIEAKALVSKHDRHIFRVADQLLERETLDREEILALTHAAPDEGACNTKIAHCIG